MKNMRYLILLSIIFLNSSYGLTNTLKIVNLEMIDPLWVINYDSGNITSLVNLYTHDAMVFPPSSEILEGPIAITTYLNNLREVGFNEYSISNVNTQVKGDKAFTTALWEAIRVGVDGNKIKFNGNITNVLERQNDGNWKIKLQSWN